MQALASSLEAHADDKAKPIEAASLRAAVQSPQKLSSSAIKADALPTLSHTSPAKAVSKPVTQPAPSPTAVRLPSSLYFIFSSLSFPLHLLHDVYVELQCLFVCFQAAGIRTSPSHATTAVAASRSVAEWVRFSLRCLHRGFTLTTLILVFLSVNAQS